MAPSAIVIQPSEHDRAIAHGKPAEGDPSKKEISVDVQRLESWPEKLEGGLVWDAASFHTSADYTYELNTSEVVEIEEALRHFKGLELSGEDVDQSTFPLPTLSHQLQSMAVDLHCGRGFFCIRGLDPDMYSDEDNVLIYLGLSSYIANKRGLQDEEGFVLAHIREAKESSTEQHDRPFRDSNLGLTFHTDGYSDILAMQTRELAAMGGAHMIASSWKIFNELSKTRPDVLETLAEPNWIYDAPGQPDHGVPRPLMFYEDQRAILNFVRYAITGTHTTVRSKGLPAPSQKQLEALDALEAVALKHCIELDMQPGDLTYVNNWAICHSRQPFEDDQEHTRYLIRMWFKNESLAWKLPQQLKEPNNEIFYNENLYPAWNIQPQPRINFSIWSKLVP